MNDFLTKNKDKGIFVHCFMGSSEIGYYCNRLILLNIKIIVLEMQLIMLRKNVV